MQKKPKRQLRFFGWKKAIGSRIPEGSSFYSRVLPIVILFLGLVTAILIVIALGIITGLIPFV
jgi:hypothetical protein